MTSVASHVSKGQKARGLLAAAAIAWALTTSVGLGWPTLEVWFASTFLECEGYVPPAAQVVSWVVVYAIVGLPLALIVCLAVGFPAWRFAESRGLATRVDAMKVGAVVALIVGLSGIILSVLASLPTAMNDSSTFNSWSWGRQVVRDGLPTPLGWVACDRGDRLRLRFDSLGSRGRHARGLMSALREVRKRGVPADR